MSDLRTVRVGVVVSRFHESVTQPLYEGAYARLQERGVLPEHIRTVWVPGAVELPITAQALIRSGHVDSVIVLGVVIQGETDHYTYVCEQVSSGCQTVALSTQVPVIFGVLTTQTVAQAVARAGGEHSHKGRESADAALEMWHTMKSIQVGEPQLVDGAV